MKKEDLTALGLTEEQITSVFEMNGKDINKAKGDLDKVNAELDGYKDKYKTAQESLKKFDGIDPAALNDEISKLNKQLQDKDAEWTAKMADRDFTEMLSTSIAKAGGRNAKAIEALLNVDELKTSKNQTEDITKAIETIKADNDYLFESDEPHKNPTHPINNGGEGGGVNSAKLAEMRAAVGLPPEKNK